MTHLNKNSVANINRDRATVFTVMQEFRSRANEQRPNEEEEEDGDVNISNQSSLVVPLNVTRCSTTSSTESSSRAETTAILLNEALRLSESFRQNCFHSDHSNETTVTSSNNNDDAAEEVPDDDVKDDEEKRRNDKTSSKRYETQ
jgi:hypothetical protein